MRQVVAGVEAARRRHPASRSKTGEHLPHATKRKTGGDDGFVKVGDFGLAKIVNADRSDVTSASGPASRGIIGTPEYMAPEQMQPDAALDARADIYALGTIAYHMLGGRPPFTGNITQLIAQKLTQPPPPLSNLRSDISDEVEATIMKALAVEPKERPASANGWTRLPRPSRQTQELQRNLVIRASSSWRLPDPKFMSTMNVTAAWADRAG